MPHQRGVISVSHTNSGCGGDEPIPIHGESFGQIQVFPIRWERTTISISPIKLCGDVVTGLVGDFEGMLVVFCERSIWTVTGTGQIVSDIMDWTRTKSNAVTGCVSHRSVVRVPAGAVYTDASGNQVSDKSCDAVVCDSPRRYSII
jgi:hypothetical protein